VARRCHDCRGNTKIDGEKCILCGGCVDVCPELCLRIVSVDRLAREGQVSEVVERLLDDTAPQDASAILKDETRCIRCALCAERCPTGAITMERVHFTEVPSCQND
jgi:formate dehydrogenase beta subunit